MKAIESFEREIIKTFDDVKFNGGGVGGFGNVFASQFFKDLFVQFKNHRHQFLKWLMVKTSVCE